MDGDAKGERKDCLLDGLTGAFNGNGRQGSKGPWPLFFHSSQLGSAHHPHRFHSIDVYLPQVQILAFRQPNRVTLQIPSLIGLWSRPCSGCVSTLCDKCHAHARLLIRFRIPPGFLAVLSSPGIMLRLELSKSTFLWLDAIPPPNSRRDASRPPTPPSDVCSAPPITNISSYTPNARRFLFPVRRES